MRKCLSAAVILTSSLFIAANSARAGSLTIQSIGTANQTVGSEYCLAVNSGPAGTNSAPDSLLPHFDTIVLTALHPLWKPPIDSSKWISFLDNYSPTAGLPGDPIQNNDYLWYFHEFTLTGTTFSGSTLSILADDTLSIWVNGTQITVAGAPMGGGGPTYPVCYEKPVGCLATTQGNFNIADLLLPGNNVFAFHVFQRNGTGYGLNYSAKVNDDVPEPMTLLLVATGILGIVSARRR